MRLGFEFVLGLTSRDADHLHHIFDAFLAKTIGVHGFVGQRQLVIQHVQVSDRGVDVLRFNRIPARKMDAVKILRQL